jgi:cytidine deaminase
MKDYIHDIATKARVRAYAPYSKFLVGAALLSVSGRVFAGCNVENISFGLTMCAERVCVGNAVQEGEREFQAIIIVSDSEEPVMPCGACRQVLAEFSPNMSIVSWTLHGDKKEITLATLLPLSHQGILG